MDVDVERDKLAEMAQAQTGYRVDSVNVSFTGICAECQNENEN